MRIGCVIQARLGSTRLPNKVIADIGGWPMIKHVYRRLELLNLPAVIATPPEDAGAIGKAVGPVVAPNCPTDDVLKRYLMVAQQEGWDAVIRVTGDCPLIDPFVIKDMIGIFDRGGYDYVANDIARSFPDGLGVEIITTKALKWAHSKAVSPGDREHVSQWILRNLRPKGMFEGFNYVCAFPDIGGIKLSVDTQAELERVRRVDDAKPADYSLDATMAAYRRSTDFAKDAVPGG